MVSKLLCLVLLVVAPSALCKSTGKLLDNQMSGRPWWCVFYTEEDQPDACVYIEHKNTGKLLDNQMSGRPWWCVFYTEEDQPDACVYIEHKRQLGDLTALFNGDGAERMAKDFDMPAPFGGSGAAHQAKDAHQDTFVETLKTAAREFEEKGDVAPMRARSAAGPRKVVTCVYCDNRCVARAQASGYSSAQGYFDQAIAEMNRIVQGLDENMSLELSFVLLPYSITEMSWFFDYSATSSEQLLTAINNKFWGDSGLYNMAGGNGCDVDFLVAAPEDPAWNYMGSIEGIANMFQLCLSSYSTVMMNSNPISLAKLMTHEFGHMLGIYHDGAINAAFSGMASYFAEGQMMGACNQEYADLSGACTAGSVGCSSGKCIMAATVDGTEWSDCSKAYYSMYNCLVGVMPTYYDDTCVNA